MDIADQKGTAKETLQRLGVPTAVGVLGAGAGLILTRKPNLGNSLAGVKDGVGGVLDDLGNKLDSVTGNPGESRRDFPTSTRTEGLSGDQLAKRQRARAKRREQRRSPSR